MQWKLSRERGVFDQPTPPPPRPEDVVQYRRFTEEPGFQSIREAMMDYGNSLPPQERAILDGDYKTFNAPYLRFKAAAGDRRYRVGNL